MPNEPVGSSGSDGQRWRRVAGIVLTGAVVVGAGWLALIARSFAVDPLPALEEDLEELSFPESFTLLLQRREEERAFAFEEPTVFRWYGATASPPAACEGVETSLREWQVYDLEVKKYPRALKGLDVAGNEPTWPPYCTLGAQRKFDGGYDPGAVVVIYLYPREQYEALGGYPAFLKDLPDLPDGTRSVVRFEYHD